MPIPNPRGLAIAAHSYGGLSPNLTGGALSQSKLQQQPLGCWLIVVMVNGSPLSTERLAGHGRDKNKEQTPSIDCRGDGKRPVVVLAVCIDATARWPPEGRKGSETLSRLTHA